MKPIALQYDSDCFEGPCALCNRAIRLEPGLQLCDVERERPLCSACARRGAPELAALQALARTAVRVGRIHSRNITPPIGALLELAGAAERFAGTPCLPAAS